MSEGIAIAVVLSILNVFRHAWLPYRTTLGRVPGLDGLHDQEMHPDGEVLPGLVVFRFDAPLLFANSRAFRDDLRRLAAAAPRPTWIIIAAEPITTSTTAPTCSRPRRRAQRPAPRSSSRELKDGVMARALQLIGPFEPATSSTWTGGRGVQAKPGRSGRRRETPSSGYVR